MSKLQHVLSSLTKAKTGIVVELKKNVGLAGLHLEGEIKDRTPISPKRYKSDTSGGALQSSINTGDVKQTGNKITVEVGTNLDYAAHVEYGVTAKTKTGKDRKNPYDYHKGERVFTTGTGAGMFRKSVDAEQDNIKDIIKNGG